MATVAVVLYLVGLVLVFGVRTAQHWRRTGGTGWAGVSRDSVAARWGAATFAGALLLGLAGVVLAAMGTVPAVSIPGWLAGPAIVTAVGGLALVVASQAAMGVSWRIGVDPAERTGLVTSGVFALIRNPIFTGMVAFQAGIALMVPSWLTVSAALLLLLAVQVQVRAVEEPYLLRVHGREFARYGATIGPFVPGVGRVRRDRTSV